MTTLGIFIWSHYLYSCILTMSPDVKNAFFCHILFKLTMSRFHPCLSWEANDLEVTYKNVHATITFPSKQLFCAYGGFSWPVFFGRITESQNFLYTYDKDPWKALLGVPFYQCYCHAVAATLLETDPFRRWSSEILLYVYFDSQTRPPSSLPPNGLLSDEFPFIFYWKRF